MNDEKRMPHIHDQDALGFLRKQSANRESSNQGKNEILRAFGLVAMSLEFGVTGAHVLVAVSPRRNAVTFLAARFAGSHAHLLP